MGRCRIVLLTGMVIALSGVPCLSKVLHIPGDAATIQGGIDLSDNGDTVLVSPGIYSENISLDNLIVSLIGESGPSATTIQPADPIYPIISIYSWKSAADVGADNLVGEISGFTITGGGDSPTIQIYGPASFTIRDNILRDNIPEKIYDKAVILCQGETTSPEITRNIFYGNYGVTCIQVLAGGASIVNNTFDGNRSAFISSSGSAEAVNNIVVNSSGVAIDGTFLNLDYNDVWNNDADYG